MDNGIQPDNAIQPEQLPQTPKDTFEGGTKRHQTVKVKPSSKLRPLSDEEFNSYNIHTPQIDS